MEYFIVVLNGKNQGKKVKLLPGKEVVIGRSTNCDLQIDELDISRKHCSICWQHDMIWIMDTSSNGTFLRGERIKGKTIIGSEDTITIGNTELQLINDEKRRAKIEQARSRKTTKMLVQTRSNIRTVESQIIHCKNIQEDTFSGKTSPGMLILYGVGKLTNEPLEILDLLGEILELILSLLEIERGCFLSPSQSDSSLTVYRTAKGKNFEEEKFLLSQSVVKRVLNSGQGIVCADTGRDERFSVKSSAHELKIRSLLCVPLKGKNGVLGVLYLDSVLQHRTFTEMELEVMVAVGRQVGLVIERSLLEKQLIASEQYSIIKHSRDVIYRRKQDGSFMIISPSIEKLLGIKVEKILADYRIWEKFIHPEDRKRVVATQQRIIEKGEFSLKYKMVDSQGNIKWVEDTCSTIYNHAGKVFCFQGLLKDITETQQLEERLARAKKMEALGVLAGGVAHDLNNILSGIVAYPDLIMMKIGTDDHIRKYLEGIKQSGSRAADLVQDLLMLARRESYHMQILDFNKEVESYVYSLACETLQKRHRNVELRINISSEPLGVNGSIGHLAKAVMNLVVNAFQAMPDGGVLEVHTERITITSPLLAYDKKIVPGTYVRLTVSDTGEGISAGDLERIFEPFYSKKLHRGGTGLGLSVVYGVVQDHNSYLHIESEIGKGTKFCIYLPYYSFTERKQQTPETYCQGSGQSILVVDDEIAQRCLAEEILSTFDYDVHCAASGEEAVRFIEQNKVDLVLLDMIMEGGIDGIETYRRIQRIAPQLKVVIVSGFAKPDKVQEARDLGVIDYVEKPYTIERISHAVYNALRSPGK